MTTRKKRISSILIVLAILMMCGTHTDRLAMGSNRATGAYCLPEGVLISIPGSEKPVEQLAVGDLILSYNPQTKQVEEAAILTLAVQHHHVLYELDFGSTKIKVAEDQPFYSTGKYYSVVKNDTHGVQTKAFAVGQKIDFLVDGKLKKVKLKEIKKIETCENTHTITGLDKNRLYFANGACISTETVTQDH